MRSAIRPAAERRGLPRALRRVAALRPGAAAGCTHLRAIFILRVYAGLRGRRDGLPMAARSNHSGRSLRRDAIGGPSQGRSCGPSLLRNDRNTPSKYEAACLHCETNPPITYAPEACRTNGGSPPAAGGMSSLRARLAVRRRERRRTARTCVRPSGSCLQNPLRAEAKSGPKARRSPPLLRNDRPHPNAKLRAAPPASTRPRPSRTKKPCLR